MRKNIPGKADKAVGQLRLRPSRAPPAKRSFLAIEAKMKPDRRVATSARRSRIKVHNPIVRDASMLHTLHESASGSIGASFALGANMLAIAASASASHGLSPALILIIIGAVLLAAFWQTILKIAIAALIIGFLYLFITCTVDVVHLLHALIP